LKQRLLISLALFACGLTGANMATAALVAQPQGYALPSYFVQGQLTKGGAPAGAGRTVTFYFDRISQEATATTDASGNYSLNVYELYYNYGTPEIKFSPTDLYQMAVYKGDDNFGKNAFAVNLSATAGFVTQNIALIEGEGPTLPNATILLSDIGRIRNTKIVRLAEDLKLTWGYDTGGPTPVNVYEFSGAGAVFDATATPVSVGTNLSAAELVLPNKAHDGLNYYYRVVPQPLLPSTTVMSDANNSITAGKVEISCPRNLYVFAGIPFQEDNCALADIIGDQLGDSSEYLWWKGEGWGGATYTTATGWSGKPNLRLGDGFVLMATAADKKVALVGRFGKLVSPASKQIVGGKYNLFSYSYPTARTLVAMGIAAQDSADLLRWVVYKDASRKQYYEGATYLGGSSTWSAAPGVAGIDSLSLAEPRFYAPASPTSWQIVFP
jgi:hypothetical protein